MVGLNKRIESLEQQRRPPGKTIVVGLGAIDWTAEQLADAVKAAEAKAGADDVVIAVQYVDNWRGPMGDTGA